MSEGLVTSSQIRAGTRAEAARAHLLFSVAAICADVLWQKPKREAEVSAGGRPESLPQLAAGRGASAKEGASVFYPSFRRVNKPEG